jgi:hypothetical protein
MFKKQYFLNYYMKNYLFLIAILLTIFVLGCTKTGPGGAGEIYTLTFHVNETNEILNGDVYISGELINTTQNGTLNIDVSELFPGTLQLKGDYNGANFVFNFTLTRDMIDHFSRTDYWVYERDVDMLSFNASSSIDTAKVANKIFEEINNKRRSYGYQTLELNQKLEDSAENYAKELARGSGYNKNPADRFIENKIAYIMPGTYYYWVNIFSPDVDVANFTINDIFASTSSKNMVLNEDYDKAGVGVYCEKNKCYVAIDLAQTKFTETFDLEDNHCTYRSIYWDEIAFSYPINVKLTVNTSDNIDFYILESEDDYKACTPTNYIDSSEDMMTFTKDMTAQKGYIMSFYARDPATVTYTLEFEP